MLAGYYSKQIKKMKDAGFDVTILEKKLVDFIKTYNRCVLDYKLQKKDPQ